MDVAKRHRLAGFGTLAGDKPLAMSKKRTLLQAVEAAEKQEAHRENKPLVHSVEDLDLFERSKFVWQTIGKHYRLTLRDGGSLWCCAVDGGYSPLQAYPSGRMRELADGVLPLDYCMGVCEDKARQMDAAQSARKDAPWRGAPATEKQVNALRRMGVSVDDGMTKGEASELLTQTLGAAATNSQRWFISRHGLHAHPELLTKGEAGRLIGAYKARGARCA